jgi:hypothetical protein
VSSIGRGEESVGRRFDRRAVFFVGAAFLCLLLAPVAEQFAWVCLSLTVVYLLLAVASYVDARTKARLDRDRAAERRR